jgi:osmoprotectant transport system ATP-binding protein
MLELEKVSKQYAGAEGVRNISLRLPSGQTTVLIGPSGAGKSTILRLILGLVVPDSGTVSFGGEPIHEKNALPWRRRMGYVIQDGGLFPHLTARGNVSLMPGYLGWERSRIDNRLAELVQLTRFPADGLDRYPAQLSGGQCQRVGLMRSLMLDPDILLLDEPLGALDPLVRSELQTDLRGIFRTLGKTVVMVTHDLSEAGFFGQLIVLLRDGTIVQKGTLNDLLSAPAEPFVTQFVNAQRQSIGGGKAPC